MGINHRAYYKLDVDKILRALEPPIILPTRSKHPMWTEIEQDFYAAKTVQECAQRIRYLMRGE